MGQHKLIGVTGYIGSGKTLVRTHLVHQHGFLNLPFAGPLKQMLLSLGLTDRHVNGNLKQEPTPLLDGKTPRQAMQTLGTEWGRQCMGDYFWVNRWEETLKRLVTQDVVADDLRFVNEATRIKLHGGRIIRLRRPGVVATSHASERDVDWIEADIVIDNDGTPEELLAKVDVALLTLFSSQTPENPV